MKLASTGPPVMIACLIVSTFAVSITLPEKYLLKSEPSLHLLLQKPLNPPAEEYGYQASVTIP